MKASGHLLWSGSLFTVSFLAAGIGAGMYEFMPPPADLVALLERSSQRLVFASYLGFVAAAALVWFGAALQDVMRGREVEGPLPALAAGGAVLAAALVALGFLAGLAGAERFLVTGEIDAVAAATLFDLWSVAVGSGLGLGLALLIAAVSAAGASLGLKRWFRWASGTTAVVLLTPFAWAALALVLLWMPAVSVLVARTETAGTRPLFEPARR